MREGRDDQGYLEVPGLPEDAAAGGEEGANGVEAAVVDGNGAALRGHGEGDDHVVLAPLCSPWMPDAPRPFAEVLTDLYPLPGAATLSKVRNG